MICKYAEFFCWKHVSSFCSAKATHIFSAKNIRILCIKSAKTVNEMTLNELVKLMTLWTTGPRYFSYFSMKTCCGHGLEAPLICFFFVEKLEKIFIRIFLLSVAMASSKNISTLTWSVAVAGHKKGLWIYNILSDICSLTATPAVSCFILWSGTHFGG